MIKTKIIATLGPASSTAGQIYHLIRAGVDVFRINLSHGDHGSQAALIAAVKEAREQADSETAILLDTRAPRSEPGACPRIGILGKRAFSDRLLEAVLDGFGINGFLATANWVHCLKLTQENHPVTCHRL